MDFSSHEAGVDDARKRVAGGAAAASTVRTRPRELDDDSRRAPPPPRAAEGRRGGGGGGGGSNARDGGPGKAAEDAGGGSSRRATSRDVGGGSAARQVADGARDARRGGGPVKAAEVASGGGASRSGGLVDAGASPGDGLPGAAAAVAAPREGRGGGGEVRSKRPLSSAPSPRAHPPPERRKVPASPRSRPGGGRGTDDDDDGPSWLVAAPARTALGGSAALPKKTAAPLAARSVGDAGSSAAAVPRPIARGGHPRQDAGALRSPEPPRQRRVAAADAFSDTASQGGSGIGGFGRGKGLVSAKMLVPKPTTAIRRFGPGRGRVTASQPVNKSAYQRLCTESNELSTATGSSSDLRMRVTSACRMGSINKPEDIADSILRDDRFSRELADHEREVQKKFNVSSRVPLDARTRVMMMRERFKFIFEATLKFVQQSSQKVGRIDLTADIVIKKLPGFTPPDPMIGNVPGVEIGDEFVYRVELGLVGLHGPPRGGIGTTKDGSGLLVAVSIVASGGYPDELSSSGELIYTGSGGKFAGKKVDENQKLERGNLGLKNCIETKTPVRVIYGLKWRREKGSHPRPKGASSFIYDGLYHVVACQKEGQAGAKVFKYTLQRIPRQPQLHYCSKTGIMCVRRSQ